VITGNNEYESDRYQVVPVSTWTWGVYSDYIRSRLDTFNTSYSDYILGDFAPEHVRNSLFENFTRNFNQIFSKII